MKQAKAESMFGRRWSVGIVLFCLLIGWMLFDIMQREGDFGRRSDVLVMGTNAGFKPFEYREKGEIIGFDVDLAKEIAKEAGKELRIEDMSFDGLIPALNSGQVDMVIAGMSVTPDRQKNALFSDPYYSASQKMIVKNSSDITNRHQLDGKKIGVQLGTTGDILASKIPGAKVIQFPTAPSVLTELASGGVEVVILDDAPARQYIWGFSDLKILPGELSTEDYAIAIKSGNQELLKIANRTIANMRQDGRYQQLVEKYFGSGLNEVRQ